MKHARAPHSASSTVQLLAARLPLHPPQHLSSRPGQPGHVANHRGCNLLGVLLSEPCICVGFAADHYTAWGSAGSALRPKACRREITTLILCMNRLLDPRARYLTHRTAWSRGGRWPASSRQSGGAPQPFPRGLSCPPALHLHPVGVQSCTSSASGSECRAIRFCSSGN